MHYTNPTVTIEPNDREIDDILDNMVEDANESRRTMILTDGDVRVIVMPDASSAKLHSLYLLKRRQFNEASGNFDATAQAAAE